MAEIDSLYGVAGPIVDADLAGLWILTRHVATNRFLEGRDGPDAVWTIDSSHTAPVGAQTMGAWTLLFAHDSAGVQLTENVGGGPRRSSPAISPAGDLLFEPDFAADAVVTYHCRRLADRHLVCVDKQHIGNGFELRRLR